MTPIEQIRTNPGNLRTHPLNQIRQLARSIRVFGFISPLHHDIDPAWGEKAAVSRPGDLWFLGPHRLLCRGVQTGDDVRRLVGDYRVAIAFIDPSNDAQPNDGGRSLKRVLERATAVSREGAIHFVFTNSVGVFDLAARAAENPSRLLDVVVWVKPIASPGSMYRDQRELIGVIRIGATEGSGDKQSRPSRRGQSNVWRYPGAASLPYTFPDPLRSRARLVPAALIADAVKDRSRRNDIILDSSCGAGTMVMAAERLKRRACSFEQEPMLVDGAIRQGQATGQSAFLAESRLPFNAAEAKRVQAQNRWER